MRLALRILRPHWLTLTLTLTVSLISLSSLPHLSLCSWIFAMPPRRLLDLLQKERRVFSYLAALHFPILERPQVSIHCLRALQSGLN